jgi:hypothetical protein
LRPEIHTRRSAHEQERHRDQDRHRARLSTILAAQLPAGNWVKDGPGYSPKYTATVWQVIFLDQLGADPNHPQVRAACEFVLDRSRAESGGFGASAVQTEPKPAPSRVIHCLNGNLMRALLGFGYLDDPRLQAAIDWEARSILGVEGFKHYDGHGPGFACGANEGLPCAWGAVKALLGLAHIPHEARSSLVSAAIDRGVEFLLSRDPGQADYPMGWGNTKPNSSWFKLGFPSGYVADVLQNLEALCEQGRAADPRLENAVAWLLSKQDAQGRWRNEYAYNRKTWVDFEKQGAVSKWVTLRACRVLKMVHEAAEPARV